MKPRATAFAPAKSGGGNLSWEAAGTTCWSTITNVFGLATSTYNITCDGQQTAYNTFGLVLIPINETRGTVSLLRVRGYLGTHAAGSPGNGAELREHTVHFILQLVRDNLGADTTVAARKLSSTYLDVQANPSLGPSITKAYAWRNLLDVIREVSDATRKAGSVVYFGIVPVTETQFQMRVQLTQWGRDRTADSGYPLTFSLENENMANPHLVEDAREEVTTAYGLGDGEDSLRDVQTSTDTTREGVSVFGRREAAINAVGNATAGVLDAADGRVNKGRPVTYFTATLLSVPGCIYGVDWGFGDLVTVSFDGRQFDALIRAVTVSVDENGRETLACVLEAYL